MSRLVMFMARFVTVVHWVIFVLTLISAYGLGGRAYVMGKGFVMFMAWMIIPYDWLSNWAGKHLMKSPIFFGVGVVIFDLIVAGTILNYAR